MPFSQRQQQQHDLQRNENRLGVLPITSRSSAASSAPPVATLRSLRTNGEEEVEEEEIDGEGVAELDALLLEGGRGISAAAAALLVTESKGGSPRSESTSRT